MKDFLLRAIDRTEELGARYADIRIIDTVKDLRFTQSYVEALANVEAVTRQTKTLATKYGTVIAFNVPGLLISDFNFTGVTV